MTILVTGVAGFLGSHVADHLLAAGHKVVGIDNLSGGVEVNVPPGVRFIWMDVRDEKGVDRLFAHIKIDAIVHCAAFAAEVLSHNCRIYTYQSIVLGSAVLVNAAVNNGVKVFVAMSSIGVYGHQVPPFVESVPPSPIDPYGVAKAAMEADLKAAHSQLGLNYVIFRPHNIIGTRQNLADKTRNVASIFIRQALSGQSFSIFGDGNQTRGFSPVKKVASIIAASVDRPGVWNQTFNVGGDRVMSVMRMATVVAHQVGLDEVKVDMLAPRNEVMHAHSLHDKVKEAFPDLANVDESIEETILEMIVEARKSTLPPVAKLPRIEVQKNLPESWKSQPSQTTSS